MVEPRGPSGSVRGLSRRRVRKLLPRVVRHVLEDGRGVFRRAQLRDWIHSTQKVSRHQAEGVVFFLVRMDHVEPVGDGSWRVTERVERHAAHPHWRFPTGDLDAASLAWLADRSAGLTGALARLTEREAPARGQLKMADAEWLEDHVTSRAPVALQELRDRAADALAHLETEL